MVELILAGVIIGAVMAFAAVTGVRDWRSRRAERREAAGERRLRNEPIPSGWAANGAQSVVPGGGTFGDGSE
ncbi:MAG TPA: hypothetical protein VHG10_03445 [Glycomyces sp.]|nr:hypothetical protein [Glycomyces sp.]